jgi:hypothetical protein
MILLANSTFEGTFYFSQAPKVVDIPHREEKNDLFCGIFPHFLHSPTIWDMTTIPAKSGHLPELDRSRLSDT